MNGLLKRRLALLAQGDGPALLAGGLRGIEREALRIDPHGRLALTGHPAALGAALTHPSITTDYAEALIELITPPEADIGTMLQSLDNVHRFVMSQLGDEMLWGHSMPCALPDEAAIPIAWYGTSHIGMLKHVYRRGLALRYGKAMQCIAGIHYNFSLEPGLWERLRLAEDGEGAPMHYQSGRYVALIRNFRRYGWLLAYLFGASPALSAGYQGRCELALERLSDDTLFLPYATSLRMSDMGYQNEVQAGLTPDYNTLDSYITSLAAAMNQPYLPYVEMGTRREGAWVQLNTNRLQIENEYYSAIRPKRVVKSGERPLHALAQRGIQYVEVRCLDVDPFEPLGIGAATCHFLDAFLLFCALDDSPLTGAAESGENTGNFARVVTDGRRPGLVLARGGRRQGLAGWGRELLDRIAPIAAALDAARGGAACTDALAAQYPKLDDPECTPSGRVLEAIHAEGSFAGFALRRSRAHAAQLRAHPPDPARMAVFAAQARGSLAEQAQAESNDRNEDFAVFLRRYQAGLRHLPSADPASADAAQRVA